MTVEVKMDSEYLIVINGVNHVIFDEVLDRSNWDKMYARFKKFNALPTRLRKVNHGLFTVTYVVVSVLVPEQNALEYSRS